MREVVGLRVSQRSSLVSASLKSWSRPDAIRMLRASSASPRGCRSRLSPLCRGTTAGKATTKLKTEKGKSKSANVSPPMQVTIEEQLTALDKTNQPLWSTFCGVTNGVWQGKMAAFFSATGEPEVVFKDGKTKVFDLHTLVVEERPDDDVIVRRTLRSPRISDVRSASLPDLGDSEASSDSGRSTKAAQYGKDWEIEEVKDGEDGLIIFDGGTFSRGPHHLIDPRLLAESQEDESEEAPEENSGRFEATGPDVGTDAPRRTTSVIEQCLAWGGEQRIRLQITLSAEVEDDELDIEVLRLALWREAWQGLSEQCAVDQCVASDVKNPAESTSELTNAERADPKLFDGTWKAYDLAAVPIEDEDPVTGEVKRICLYFGQETRQRWSRSKPGFAADGAAIWLPNRVLVELQMVQPSSRGVQADEEEGMQDGSPGRGFLLTFSWAVKENTVIGLHREYDARGELLECRNRTAVQGSWVGGRM